MEHNPIENLDGSDARAQRGQREIEVTSLARLDELEKKHVLGTLGAHEQPELVALRRKHQKAA